MKKLMLVCAVCSLLLAACKKDKTDYVTDTYAYYPMEAGNYWVYEWYEIDTNGNEVRSTYPNDSTIVVGDTLISGKSFYQVESNLFGSSVRTITCMRDSAMWMIDETGKRLFSVDPQPGYFDNDYSVSGVDLVSHMDYGGYTKQTPVGTFTTITKVTEVTKQSGTFCNGSNKRSFYKGFARGIGPVFYNTFYLSDPECRLYDARLIRFHVSPI